MTTDTIFNSTILTRKYERLNENYAWAILEYFVFCENKNAVMAENSRKVYTAEIIIWVKMAVNDQDSHGSTLNTKMAVNGKRAYMCESRPK